VVAEIVMAVLALLAVLVPFFIKLYWKKNSKKEAEKKRRIKEDQDLHEAFEKAQERARADGAAHDIQEQVLRERKKK